MNAGKKPHRRERRERAGFTLIELAIVMVVAGLLLVPLLRMAGSSIISDRLKKTQSVLEMASGALISHAAAHAGCLPFAADFEGGLPDTDAGGAASGTPDTGKQQGGGGGQNAGDMPWADLGLTNEFLDGDGLRIQYYVASPYSDNGENCDAGFRGFPYSSGIKYDAGEREIYVYDFKPGTSDRTLYEIKKDNILTAGTHPSDGGASVNDYSNQELLPDPLLQVRRGPDVTATVPQNDVISSQNVFILIAPGQNRNADIDRQFIRDSSHVTDTGAVWALGTNTVDDYIFSSVPNVDAGDSANSGDDTMFVMSFTRFRAEMNKHGLNMEPVCESFC